MEGTEPWFTIRECVDVLGSGDIVHAEVNVG